VFPAFPLADADASPAGSGKATFRIASAGTGKIGGRTGLGAAAIFCCGSRESRFAVALPGNLCALFPPAAGTFVGTAGVVSRVGCVSSCAAHIEAKLAAKLPELREPEFTRLNKPAAEAGATLVRIAGSRAEVMVKVSS
jgi:hypothetical protein